MLPRDLRPDHFRAYPPEAAKLAVDSLPALRRLPLSFLPSLLREVIEYDYKFPAERAALEKEVAKLVSLSDSQVANLFGGFSKITLSPQLESSDWVSSPAQFVEQLSAHLWTTHQLDDFRVAATKYADDLSAAVCTSVSQTSSLRHVFQPRETRERSQVVARSGGCQGKGPSSPLWSLVR